MDSGDHLRASWNGRVRAVLTPSPGLLARLPTGRSSIRSPLPLPRPPFWLEVSSYHSRLARYHAGTHAIRAEAAAIWQLARSALRAPREACGSCARPAMQCARSGRPPSQGAAVRSRRIPAQQAEYASARNSAKAFGLEHRSGAMRYATVGCADRSRSSWRAPQSSCDGQADEREEAHSPAGAGRSELWQARARARGRGRGREGRALSSELRRRAEACPEPSPKYQADTHNSNQAGNSQRA